MIQTNIHTTIRHHITSGLFQHKMELSIAMRLILVGHLFKNPFILLFLRFYIMSSIYKKKVLRIHLRPNKVLGDLFVSRFRLK